MIVFVDFDGTVTDRDSFDVLVRAHGDAAAWLRYERLLAEGKATLRETLEAQARLIRCSLDEAAAILAEQTQVDPAFVAFLERCERTGIAVRIVSSGIAPLIERLLARAGVTRAIVLANDVEARRDGWQIRFRDRSANGHDKAARVRAARATGKCVAYVGDGRSDFEAALAADLRYAKRGRPLERFLRNGGIAYHGFATFTEVCEHLLAS